MLKTLKNILIYLFFPVIFVLLFTSDINSKLYISLMFLSYILLGIYFYIIYKDDLLNDFKTFNKRYFKSIFTYFFIGFCLSTLSNLLINTFIIPNGISNNELSNIDYLLKNKFLYSIILCILIPIIEEVVFRLELKKKYKNKYLFIIISSSIFSILHLLSNTHLIELRYFIPYFIIGYTFSSLYYKTNNIYTNILTHMLHNSVIVIYYLLFL